MTFLEMQTEVFRRLEEASGAPVFWTLAQIKESINKGYREISDSTEWYEVTDTIALTANQYVYDMTSATEGLSPAALTVKACWNDQTDRWMTPTDVRTLDNAGYYKWETATGEPDMWYIRGLWWLGFERAVAATAGTVTVYYSALPADLSADADTPAFPQEFHLALVEFAVYDCLCQDRENTKALYFYTRYIVKREALRKYVQQRDSKDRVGVIGREWQRP